MHRSLGVVDVSPDGAGASRTRVGPKRQEALFSQTVLAIDVTVLIASFFLAYVLRDNFEWYGELLPLRQHLWVLTFILVLWPTLARAVGLMESQTYLWPRRVFALTARVHVVGGLTLLSCLYLLRAVEVSRLFIQAFFVVSAVALSAERATIRRVLMRSAARVTPYRRRALVVGTTPEAARFDRLLNTRPHWGSDIAAFLVADGPVTPLFCRKPVLGRTHDLERLVDTNIVVDDVVLAAAIPSRDADQIVQICAERGITFHTLVRMPAPQHVKHHAEALGNGLYLMSLERTPQHIAPLLVKRTLDVIGGCVGLLCCALTYVIVAAWIKLSSAGPVIFKQTRVGRNGRHFTMYKFRTMRRDAEAQKQTLTHANEIRGHLFKINNDPRITPIGRLLRQFYLDELPQFWNVLKGDMSLVGPRPPLPEEVAQYAPYHRRRLSVRPGITGPWQMTGNGAIGDFDEIVRLECDYIDQWTLRSDFAVLLRTCLTVARMGGQ